MDWRVIKGRDPTMLKKGSKWSMAVSPSGWTNVEHHVSCQHGLGLSYMVPNFLMCAWNVGWGALKRGFHMP